MEHVILNKGETLDGRKYLCIYVITGPNTSDFPGQFTVRQQWAGSGVVYAAHDPVGHGATLEEVRKFIPSGLVLFHRSPEDDPVIVESWL